MGFNMQNLLINIEEIIKTSTTKKELIDKLSSIIINESEKKLKINSIYTEVGRIQDLEEALEFYADPDSYFAVGFFIDRPAGGFADDFSDDHDGDYERPMAGKLAREVLSHIKKVNLDHFNKNEKKFVENDNVDSLEIIIKYQYVIAQIRSFRPELTECDLATKIDDMSKSLNQDASVSVLDCLERVFKDKPLYWEI
jgi:hypothetical protein